MVDHAASSRPTRRAVILGASNVTMSLSTVVETARRAWGQPLEFLAAIGHGRSYGLTTNVLGRGLPGIVRCGLWDELEQRPPLPTAALVTDIGNDIIYGCPVDPILKWLETCLTSLARWSERLVITRLPLDSISTLPEWKIRLLLSLFFPNSRLKRDDALAKALELDQRLTEFANRFGAYVVQPEANWYTWDPLHIARRYRPVAWSHYMTWWCNGHPPTQATPSLRRWFALQRSRPRLWTRFGIQKHREQPSVKLSDGTTISLF
ncbi:MAG: hypothetical protein ACQESR_14280 [Planctomycetota bacterium]